ncbi:glucuronate isomerase [Clostridium sp. C105KSO13]|uniref:glucuronate isomerase n=1 Tax=Clostridium sp. C105KSO13 TaxID=1776045 RepID=UPI0007405A10|nr:glucuronate isomerase [Clostridium sp. C105KSO13]CUX25249.1 Uronate isomerase [Clostridium sp. C105KSO13]
MKKFMDNEFLLTTETAQHLYHDYAEKEPIIDYHCHLNPREIYEDVKYNNITQVWLGGDHYKWRQMRSNGVEEKYITGNASDREKFQKWAETLEKAIGNPLYHWSHMELKKYFGYEGYLCGDTAEDVWNLCNEKLQNGLTARKMIEMSDVEIICTTDDPVDSLEWHRKLSEEGFSAKVLPTWRPDKAMNIEKNDFALYLKKLEETSGIKIQSFESLIQALKKRMDFFDSAGCCISDHGLEYVMYEPATRWQIDCIFEKIMRGESLTGCEIRQYKTAFLIEMGKAYAEKNWVMQLHYGVQRDLNHKIFQKLGPDAGIDAINNYAPAIEMGKYLNLLAEQDALPKTILYSLNPNDNAVIGTVIGCFQDATAIGKIQQGSAWWFNDNKAGMIQQMVSLANQGLLGNFIGMLTDSRSFLSYTRHEYFRRIMCDLIGGWVENGEYPQDEKMLEMIVAGIAYKNAKCYFGF